MVAILKRKAEWHNMGADRVSAGLIKERDESSAPNRATTKGQVGESPYLRNGQDIRAIREDIPRNKTMKKLMIAAAAAAMIGGAFAECSDFDGCIAYDLTMSIKTLGPKKLVCKAECKSCGEEDTIVAYLDNVTQSIKGVIWACDWVCDCEEGGSGEGTWLAAIYDTTAKKAIISFSDEMTEGFLDELVVTDSIPLRAGFDPSKLPFKLTQLSVAPLIAEAIRRTHNDESINDLFNHE